MQRKVYEVKFDGKKNQDYLDLLNDLGELNLVGERVLIVVKPTMNAFVTELGRHCADKCNLVESIDKNITAQGDEKVYEFIGKMLLDNTLTDTYYIFSEKDNTLYKIKGDTIDESKTDTQKRKSTKKGKSN